MRRAWLWMGLALAASGRRCAGGAVSATLPKLPRRAAPGRHGAGLVAAKPGAQQAGRVAGHRARRPPGHANARLCRPAERRIQALVGWLRTPAATPPRWSEAEMAASHRQFVPLAQLPDAPGHGADPANLFVVVEAGDHHVSVLDGERFTVLARFASHYALHGGPKFSPDGRFCLLASRDGWVSQYDLYSLQKWRKSASG